jgi:hypothetical protein
MSPVFEQGLLERAGDYVKISVKDMGTGIDKEILPKGKAGSSFISEVFSDRHILWPAQGCLLERQYPYPRRFSD